MKSKDNNHTIAPEVPPKKPTIWEEYLDTGFYERRVVSDVTIEKWASQLRKWVDTPPYPLSITAFYRSLNVAKQSFYDLCNKYPVLMEAKKEAMQVIGERREHGAIMGEFNWSAVKHRLYQYMPEAGEADQYHAQIKSTEGKAEGSNEVYIVERCSHRKADEPRSIEGTE